jgi:hypothetical protein
MSSSASFGAAETEALGAAIAVVVATLAVAVAVGETVGVCPKAVTARASEQR